jgi:predicted  nucleic acid-binding Zn-ribbon protein
MVNFDYNAFISYVLKDNYISYLKSIIKNLQHDLSELFNQLNLFENDYKSNLDLINNLKKSVNIYESDIKDLDYILTRKISDLDHISSIKEYESLKFEIDTLKVKKDNLESLLIDKWIALEEQEKKFLSISLVYPQKRAEIFTSIDNINIRLRSLESDLNQSIVYLNDLEKSLIINNQDWINDYINMKSNIYNPAVPLKSGEICSGCFYIISSYDISVLNRQYIIRCKNCYRFIYLERDHS